MLHLFRTIRSKLLFAFFTFLLITTGFMVLADLWFDMREQRIQKTLDNLSTINVNLQRVEKLEYVFFKDDIINENFHETGESKNLDERQEHIQFIKADLNQLKKADVISSLDIDQDIDQLIRDFDRYNTIFNQLVELIKKRGFKDYALEGEMREYIHNIEDADYNYDRAKMLMIRRHEKDFILRKQEQYIKKLENAVEILRQEVKGNPQLVSLLSQYKNSFTELAAIEKEIGFTNKEGLKGELYELGQENANKIQKLNLIIHQQVDYVRTQNRIAQSVLILLGTLLVFILAFFVTRSLSGPISKLSASIHNVIEQKFSRDISFSRIKSNDELGMLSQDVGYMIETVQNSIAEIQEQKARVEKKQRILMDGVSYAKRIQQAVLPDYTISNYFKKYFVLFQPRYDVSGDFYWFSEMNDKYYVAVVDCTGHGVSGAFMSMIGNTLMDEVVEKKRIGEPSFILETLNTEFKMALHQEHRLSDDSLDVCLCCIEPHPEKEEYWQITFAGANRPLFYSDGWDIHEIKGSERTIGGRHMNRDRSFEDHVFELKRGNFLYLTTDGFFNQHNKTQKKYGKKQFKEFVRRIIHLPVKQQEQRLTQELNNYMEGVSQRDDITVLVLKL